MQPPVRVDGLFCRFRIVVIAQHVEISASTKFSGLTDGDRIPIRIDDLDFNVGECSTEAVRFVVDAVIRSRHCCDGRHLCLTEDNGQFRPDFAFKTLDEGCGHCRSPRGNRLQRGKVTLFERWVLHHCDEHRRDTTAEGDAVLFECIEHVAGLEFLDDHNRQHSCTSGEHGQHRSAGVKERHRSQHDVARLAPIAKGAVQRIGNDPSVMQTRPFREAGRSRGVLNHDEVTRVGLWKRRC